MKKLGTSNNRGIIVEFTEAEYARFLLAESAAKGLPYDPFGGINDNPSRGITSDMSQFFSAMHDFIAAKFQINELRNTVEGFEKLLNIEKPREEEQIL